MAKKNRKGLIIAIAAIGTLAMAGGVVAGATHEFTQAIVMGEKVTVEFHVFKSGVEDKTYTKSLNIKKDSAFNPKDYASHLSGYKLSKVEDDNGVITNIDESVILSKDTVINYYYVETSMVTMKQVTLNYYQDNVLVEGLTNTFKIEEGASFDPLKYELALKGFDYVNLSFNVNDSGDKTFDYYYATHVDEPEVVKHNLVVKYYKDNVLDSNFTTTVRMDEGTSFMGSTYRMIIDGYDYEKIEGGSLGTNTLNADMEINLYYKLTPAKPTVATFNIHVYKDGVIDSSLNRTETQVLGSSLDVSTLKKAIDGYNFERMDFMIPMEEALTSYSINLYYTQVVTTFKVSGLGSSSPSLTSYIGKGGDDYTAVSAFQTASTGQVTTAYDSYFNFVEVVQDGSTFIKIPKIYKKFTITNAQVSGYELSFKQIDDSWKLYPCFESGDYLLYGKYKATYDDTKLYSKTGQATPNNKTIGAYRTLATATGTKYSLGNIYTKQLFTDLAMMALGTTQLDSLTTGSTAYNLTTGALDNSYLNYLDSSSKRIKLFGIEDPIYNGYEFLDGICFKSNVASVSPDHTKNNDTGADYTTVGLTLASSNAYISALGYEEANPFVNLPTAVNGSAATYYCDYWYKGSSTNVLYWGGYSADSYYGLSFLLSNVDFADASALIGARLCCLSV